MPQNPVDRGVPKPSKSAQNNRKSAEKAIAAAAKRTAAAAAKRSAANGAGPSNTGPIGGAGGAAGAAGGAGAGAGAPGAAGGAGTAGAAGGAGAPDAAGGAGAAGAAGGVGGAGAAPAQAADNAPLDLSHLSKSEHKYLKRQREIEEYNIKIVSLAKIYGPCFLCSFWESPIYLTYDLFFSV